MTQIQSAVEPSFLLNNLMTPAWKMVHQGITESTDNHVLIPFAKGIVTYDLEWFQGNPYVWVKTIDCLDMIDRCARLVAKHLNQFLKENYHGN